MRSTVQLVLASVVGLSACGPQILSVDDDTTTSNEPPPSGPTSDGSAPMPVSGAPTSDPTPPNDGPDSTEGPAGEVEGVTTEPPPPILDFNEPVCAPIGTACVSPDDCCDGQCFALQGPLGGVCSHCDADEDCEFGCEDAWPLDFFPAACGNGQIGSSCETSDACVPELSCAPFIQMPGVLETNTCGECITDDDCSDGRLCAPLYAPAVFLGFRACIEPSSQPIGGGCLADEHCEQGRCAEALLSGIPAATVCSECTIDSDCDSGRCVAPEVIVDGSGVYLEVGYCA